MIASMSVTPLAYLGTFFLSEALNRFWATEIDIAPHREFVKMTAATVHESS
jgi:hypothetical protein